MPEPDLRKKIGQLGENLAQKWLRKKGYVLLTKNYHIFGGQIDIIMQNQNGDIVFVEVKTQNTTAKFNVAPLVSKRQCLSLQRTAYHYLAEHELQDKSWQFDVVCIKLDTWSNQAPHARIRHHQNILGM
jgi:putative endonuclease